MPSLFTAQELAFIRKELLPGFGCLPYIVDGVQLHIWKSGEARGQPRVPVAVQTMCSRGLMEIKTFHLRVPRAFFTDDGLQMLRTALEDKRLFPSKYFDHLREQLGVNGAVDESTAFE